MFAVGLFILTVGASLYIWGMVRTAIWIIPTLGFPELGPIFGASVLTFFTLSSFLIPYQTGAFDGRALPKNRWALIFIATAILAGNLLNPQNPKLMGVCLISIPFIIAIFHLFKHPPSRSLHLPKRLKWILLGLWIFTAILRLVEARLYFS